MNVFLLKKIYIFFTILFYTTLSFANSEYFKEYDVNGFSKKSIRQTLKENIELEASKNIKLTSKLSDRNSKLISRLASVTADVEVLCSDLVVCGKKFTIVLSKDNTNHVFKRKSRITKVKIKGSDSGTGDFYPANNGYTNPSYDDGWTFYEGGSRKGKYWYSANDNRFLYPCYFNLGGMPHKLVLKRGSSEQKTWKFTRTAC